MEVLTVMTKEFRDGFSELMGKLDVIPTTGNDSDPVESSDAGRGRRRFIANSVHGEDLNPSESLEKKYVRGGHHHNQGGTD